MNVGRNLVERVRSSPQWQRAAPWGEPRPGHPEGSIGRHVEEQLIPFIDLHFRELPDYWNLVALAYLHDIGKPDVERHGGQIRGEPHSILSARIAAELGASDRLVRVILRNDRTFGYWRRLFDRRGRWDPSRWTDRQRAAFVAEFEPGAVDLDLLVRFRRADSGYRRAPVLEESVDPVLWFENRLLEEGLLRALPSEGKDQRFDWKDVASRCVSPSAPTIKD